MNSKAIAPLIIRIIFGISFILHGFPKLQNLAGTAQFFSKLGIPVPHISAPFVGGLEIIGGIALLLGVGTDLFAGLLAIDMLVATLSAKAGKGWVGGFELELLLCAGAVSLIFSGPGLLSLTKGWVSSPKTGSSK